MKKADIELDVSVELVLTIIGLAILVLLVAGVLLNIESIGDSIKSIIKGIF